jgi:hypothetical protein
MDGAKLAAHDTDIDVPVASPRAPDVQIERMPAADPPTERRGREDLHHRPEPEGFPRAKR